MPFEYLPILTRIKLGFDLFLIQAREKHGERFLYDRSSWHTSQYRIRICCPKHGWFRQVPRDHVMADEGCGKCGREAHFRNQISKGLEYAKKSIPPTHLEKFEYDWSSWKGTGFKFKIKCKQHGWFEQILRDHLKYNGCRKCSSAQQSLKGRLSQEEVIRRFKEKHGDRYSYDKTVYKGQTEKVIITCKIHGDFKQHPFEHLIHSGCQKCSGRHRWTTEEFIQRANEAHGNKYAYEKSIYTKALNTIIVTCPTHGDFITQPSRHVTRKDGCKQCAGRHLPNKEAFLKHAIERFGSRYDYSLVEYVDKETPVTILCPDHGAFEQKPHYHLENSIGCPSCSYNVSGKEVSWLDSLNIPHHVKRVTRIPINGTMRNVDAFDPLTNTVYEYWGSWWHGNPREFDQNEIHPKCGVTYGELYRRTEEKRQQIFADGYNLIEIWEDEYDELVKQKKIIPRPTSPIKPWNEEVDGKFKLTDKEYKKLEPHLPLQVNTTIKQRDVLNAAIWVEAHHGEWKRLPKDPFGDFQQSRTRFQGWLKRYPAFTKAFQKLVQQRQSSVQSKV